MINSTDEFIALRTSSVPEEYQRAAQEPAPLEVWKELVRTVPDMRIWVAQNKTVPISILAELACDADPQVRLMVARKRKLTHELAAQLAEDEDDAVRMAIAGHRHTPRPVLEKLTADSWDKVRQIAAQRLEGEP